VNLTTWALRWNISPAALDDLQRSVLRVPAPPGGAAKPGSEAAASAQVRLEASQRGARLWRNNLGAAEVNGQFIRWGLANDSAELNRVLKSADLIGIRPVRIEPRHVGHTIGQFVSREVKAPGWRFTGTAREVAQRNWAQLILSLGGDACFATGPGSFASWE
jgi:hypothetical protein